ncbi:hypothetical protein PVAP13_1NG392500 [Panicum virgatum]|uniref:Uncharacterized protein n=1 Tax=Panicum virgatum TaxID=38727 RepID=A0A8T0X2K9_PANVG|nr:hypothetical protein PVAP13_1NG392500 [Panicum virgatum]
MHGEHVRRNEEQTESKCMDVLVSLQLIDVSANGTFAAGLLRLSTIGCHDATVPRRHCPSHVYQGAMPKLMAPPTTTTAGLTRREAGRCARPLSLEPLKLEDGDHTGVEESPAEQRHPSSSTTTFARPPAERRHPSSSTTISARPPAERRHPSSSTTTTARPPAERRHPSSSTTTSPRPPAERRHPSPSTTLSARPPAGRRHHRGWHCTSKPSASSPVSTDDDHTAVETPKCSSATRPALHVQARHRPDAAITAKTPKCNPTTRPAWCRRPRRRLESAVARCAARRRRRG